MKLREGSPEKAGMCPKRLDRVRAALREWMVQANQHAVVALVARRGVVVLHEALGRLSPEPDSPPARTDTLFSVASISKPITATAAMILVEEGRLGLNLPVSFYLPELSGEGKDAVTVLHLLTHTSGFLDQDVDEHAQKATSIPVAPPPDSTQHPDLARYHALRRDAPLTKPPGQEMLYSNYGYDLIGEVVRRVSGRPFAEYADARIFRPLGMSRTSYGVAADRAGAVAWVTDPDFARVVREIGSVPYPHGSVFSTAIDLAAFGQMFLDGGRRGEVRVLAPTTVAAMTHNQIPGIGACFGDESFPEACWGLGWSVQAGRKGVAWGGCLSSPSAFCHVGGANFLWIDPDYKLVGAYLTPTDGRSMSSRYSLATKLHFGAYQFADAVTACIVDEEVNP